MKISKTISNIEAKQENKNLNNLNLVQEENEALENNNLKIKVFPSGINDDDLTSLFLGLVRVVKKKFELDSRAEIINLNLNNENLLKQLREKQAECNRLKNEIIYLKSKLQN